ncbi:jg4452 [Pararge aegeria aegeria]|uniref:Jg4452 protein n=1 Tax=Pararge aegeria aegeria TaxID=348720 RepID=A0A8S4S6P3_9NEOP|nr:jg4452 [Pararge aegeria aegeria]
MEYIHGMLMLSVRLCPVIAISTDARGACNDAATSSLLDTRTIAGNCSTGRLGRVLGPSLIEAEITMVLVGKTRYWIDDPIPETAFVDLDVDCVHTTSISK